jgi:hypothetical protein
MGFRTGIHIETDRVIEPATAASRSVVVGTV